MQQPQEHPELERTLAARTGEVAFRELPRDEIEAMLLRNRVGRLAFSIHDRVDIQPIHYVYEHGWLYGRTSEGNKLSTLKHNQWVAFEVDEITDIFDWRSLVIHGSFWIMRPLGSPRPRSCGRKAAELVDQDCPWCADRERPGGISADAFSHRRW